jgi:hypothetical protein
VTFPAAAALYGSLHRPQVPLQHFLSPYGFYAAHPTCTSHPSLVFPHWRHIKQWLTCLIFSPVFRQTADINVKSHSSNRIPTSLILDSRHGAWVPMAQADFPIPSGAIYF